MKLSIPSSMHEAVAFFLGDAGAHVWLSELPGKVERYEDAWKLETREILAGGVMSCCIKCSNEVGDVCVLKIPLDAPEGALEGAALAEWSRSGGVPEVLRVDPATGTILMRFIEPGTIRGEPVEAVVELIDRLHQPGGHNEVETAGFSPLRKNLELRLKWARDRFAKPEYAEGTRFIDGAARRAEHLLEKQAVNPRLLHGDLQGKNILVNNDGRMVAIDPLPVVGDLHYDAAFWCVMEEPGDAIENTLHAVAGLLRSVDYDRLHGWACALAAIEFRPYLPRSRARMLQFLESRNSL